MHYQRRTPPAPVEALNWDEFIAFGLAQPGASIVNGVPWSFTVGRDQRVTHERDDLYLLCNGGSTEFMTPNTILFIRENGTAAIMNAKPFLAEYEPVPQDLTPTADELVSLTEAERDALANVWRVSRIPGTYGIPAGFTEDTAGWRADNGEHVCTVWLAGETDRDTIGQFITQTLRNSSIIAQNEQITITFERDF